MKSVAILAIAISFQCGCAIQKDDTPHAKMAQGRSLDDAKLARSKDTSTPSTGNLELVAEISGPMPTGVTVSKSGRIFLNFPRWGDSVEFTVAELKDGKLNAYPNLETNKLDAA